MSLQANEVSEKLSILERIIRESSAISLAGFSSSPGMHPKLLKSGPKSSFKDIVTEFDVKVEEFIVGELKKNFPSENVLGEESAYKRGLKKLSDESFSDDLLWVLDPIDGTTNYSRSYPYFCTTGCLLQKTNGKYESILGVTFDPVRNEMYSAAKGNGAYLNGERIRVSAIDRLESALFVTGFASERKAKKDLVFDRFVNLTRKSLGVRRSGAAALDLAYVAIGRLDAYWECGLNAWDVGAGALLVREAQGTISHFERSEEWSVWTGEILATNTHIHELVTEELRL